METMKKQWGKPLTGVQEFVPSEYCHSCWSVMCNMNEYSAFVDDNQDGNYDYGERKHTNASHDPAELVILKDGETPTDNCWASSTTNPDRNTPYDQAHGFVRAFWFKGSHYSYSQGTWVPYNTAEHICNLTEGSYWPYVDAHGVKRPNHS